MNRPLSAWLIGLAIACVNGGDLRAADEAKIKAAIQKGRAYLNTTLKVSAGGPKSLAAYALLKTGSPKSDKEIQEAIKQALEQIEKHYLPGMPRYGHEFAYTLPCHMFLLEAADPELYKPQLESAAGYLVEHQQANGSWFYAEVPVADACDTSQAQFALLGLWAAHRAGVEIPSEAWHKGGMWFIASQREDGSFIYQPFAASAHATNPPTLSTTLAGTGSLLVVRHIFYPDSRYGEAARQAAQAAQAAQSKKKHGVLERMEDKQEQPQQKPQRRRTSGASISAAALDSSATKGLKALTSGIVASSHYQMYQYYATERLAALMETDFIGQRNWYDHVSDELIRLQTAEGAWSDGTGPTPATSFAILCLSRATAAILGKTPNVKKVGGGLLAGARGLPTDLSKLHLKDGQATQRKSQGTVDDLLAELEKTQDVAVADVQQSILESVDLDHPEKLLGEIDRLRRLAGDSRAEVRQTALWAIGRSGDVRLAPLLIAGLSDPDTDVIREASFALIVLSRKPTGLVDDKGKTVPVEPLEGTDEDASEDVLREHLKQWRSQAEPAWKKWYLSVRPYDERDDRQQLQRKR